MRRQIGNLILLLGTVLMLAGAGPATARERSPAKRVPPPKLDVPLAALEAENTRLAAHHSQLRAMAVALAEPEDAPAPATQPVHEESRQPATTRPATPAQALITARNQNAQLRRELDSQIAEWRRLNKRPRYGYHDRPLAVQLHCNSPDAIERIERDVGLSARLIGQVGKHSFYEWKFPHRSGPKEPVTQMTSGRDSIRIRERSWYSASCSTPVHARLASRS